jgi:mycofactocin precursor
MTTPMRNPNADADDVGDDAAGQGPGLSVNVAESLIEEISIDGMCGVY